MNIFHIPVNPSKPRQVELEAHLFIHAIYVQSSIDFQIFLFIHFT